MTRFALGVPELCEDVARNREALRRLAHEAAEQGAALVLFPEAAATMLSNDDNPAHDLPLGEPIPDGETLRMLAEEARRGHLWIGVGLLERAGEALYDSAVLLNAEGEIALHYRRITPGWHGRRADPRIYREGNALPVSETPWGRTAFLICGDLFEPTLAQQARNLSLDLLLYPFARSFAEGIDPMPAWEEERHLYAEAAASVGALTLMSNYLGCDDCFGGAMVISPRGAILAEYPPLHPGLLFYDLSLA